MEFLDEFKNIAALKEVFDNVCRRSKPGADKITYKVFEADFNKNLETIRGKIEKKKYKFTRFEISLKPKKHYQLPRLIFKSTIRDRFVAKIMCKYALDLYKEMDYIPVKSRNDILGEIAVLLKERTAENTPIYRYFIRLDIHSYYDSINRELLKSQLIKDRFDEYYMSLVDSLFYTMDISINIPSGRGVPQGISVSSILAERYLKELGEKYNKNQDVKFLRYVDDIIILVSTEKLCSSVFKNVLFDIQSKYGLTVNSDKQNYGCIEDQSFEFLGVEVNESGLRISENQFLRVENQLTELFQWYKKSIKDSGHVFSKTTDPNRIIYCLLEKLNLLITGYFYKSVKKNGISKYGWVLTSLPRYLSDLEKLKQLDAFIIKLIDNYVQDEKQNTYMKDHKKSFYWTFINFNFKENEDMYILDQDKIAEDEKLMYQITCNLSLVDMKKDLDYRKYDKDDFEQKVEESLYNYFRKTLYISNRSLTSEILYW